MKKGNTTLDFLVTYGWAILVIMLTIFTVVYLNKTDPSRFATENCTIIGGVSCEGFQLDSNTNTIFLIVKNKLDESLDASEIFIDFDNDELFTHDLDCGSLGDPLNPGVLESNEIGKWVFDDCPSLPKNKLLKGGIAGRYTLGNSMKSYALKGGITARVS